MLIYEVNLEVNSSIFDEYMLWLRPHIMELLALDGFLKADILFDKQDERDVKKVTVAYYINDYKNYHDYLDNHAQNMRKDALERFNGQFVARSRRVLELVSSYVA